jgi:aldehyde:ferredoxin oxidoreductase
MALAYGTCSIGAHHKDAWVIAWEVKTGRDGYTAEKVDKVIELQHIRGGVFECLTVCRLPWVEVGLELEWYPRFLHAATSFEMPWERLNVVGDRVFNLIRAFWVREYGRKWSSEMDVPPARWFEEPLTEGSFKGAKLNRTKYAEMLQMYYQKRGWDSRGIPRESTLARLGLGKVTRELGKHVNLFE